MTTMSGVMPDFYFNPRTHVECDKIELGEIAGSNYFNPRTHVECDRGMGQEVWTVYNFNPRTHVECDMQEEKGFVLWEISIHALM